MNYVAITWSTMSLKNSSNFSELSESSFSSSSVFGFCSFGGLTGLEPEFLVVSVALELALQGNTSSSEFEILALVGLSSGDSSCSRGLFIDGSTGFGFASSRFVGSADVLCFCDVEVSVCVCSSFGLVLHFFAIWFVILWLEAPLVA